MLPFSHRSHAALAILLIMGSGSAAPAVAQGRGGRGAQPAARPVGEPRFVYVGPSSAGRISAAAAVAGKPGVYYAGAASGGVWKSADGGTTWKPTFDNESSQAIGALAAQWDSWAGRANVDPWQGPARLPWGDDAPIR